MRALHFIFALCNVIQVSRTQFFLHHVYGQQIQNPQVSYNQVVGQRPPDRLPVNGFGVPQSSEKYSSFNTSFSNPPPPIGSGKDPATQTCGLAPPYCVNSRYRSIDGSCNNLIYPSLGMPQTPYGRLAPYNYADGIYAWPKAKSGHPLPNPRLLSLVLFPDRNIVDPIWNLNAQQWGQIITHDMSLTAGVPQTRNKFQNKNPVECCNDNGQLTSAVTNNPLCAPILIPPNDPVHAPQGTQCMNFVRTGTTRDRGCTPAYAPAEPISTVTAYMDMSIVYGNSPGQAAPLRAGQGGKLRSVKRGGQEWPPQDPNTREACESAVSPNEPCYLAGDIRVNQNPQLTALQITLMREHNRIAEILYALNPDWQDETIFQEARRILIAEIQHINYYEYLPIFLGFENMVKNKLIYPGVKGYVNDYNPAVDPSVLDEHATAAFRHFHTLIRGYLELINEKREKLGAARLSDWLNRPSILEYGNAFADLTRGLTGQAMHFSDQFWDSEITTFLFRRNNTYGGDLRASDINRGRDHGLPSYVTMRKICGLKEPKSFDDIHDFISPDNVKVLKSMYASHDDLDLVTCGSIEKPVPGAQVGPTFLCILTEQFYRTRVGDRYFYENGADSITAFTPAQLESIRRGASMARLLCDNNKDINYMQPKAFELPSAKNPLVPCDSLPAIDLTLWQGASGAYKGK